MKAKDAYGSFKRKTAKTAEKVKSFAKQNKKSIAMGLGSGAIFTAGYGLGKKNGKK